MKKLNVIGFDTRFGFRTTELIEGDITMIEAADVMVVSAYAESYFPLEGTVIRALLDNHGIESEALAQVPELELRQALGVWISRELPTGPAKRLLFVEMGGTGRDLGEALDNVFAALMVASAKGMPTSTVAMPLLGAGSQHIDAAVVASQLLPRVRRYLERSLETSLVQFVEWHSQRAGLVSRAMDETLGRIRVSVPREKLADALRADINNRIAGCTSLFKHDAIRLKHDWIRLLQDSDANSVEFGILARKLVELVVARMEMPPGHLAERIRSLERSGKAPPWICGYMQVLRHLGNDAAHSGAQGVSHEVTPYDLVAGFYCVQRLLDFWIDRAGTA